MGPSPALVSAAPFASRRSRPALRFFCHCTICQRVYQAPFADVTAQWSARVTVAEGGEHLSFARHAWWPASVRRGRCARCERPVLGHLQFPPSGVAFVPTRVWSAPQRMPEPVGHIFYHSRTEEVDDDRPKVSGLMASEWAVTSWMLPRLLRS
jgi:hypothetical protein